MPIFSRRAIQRYINQGAQFLNEPQVQKFVTDLNGDPASLVAREWELAILCALSRFGKVSHEPSFGGRTRPDIFFSLSPPATGSFAAEIATVSDKFAHEENPIRELQIELWRLVRKRGLNPSKFSLSVGGEARAAFRDGARPRLRIPPKQGFKSEAFRTAFNRFLSSIKESPSAPRVYQIKESEVDLTVGYSPSQEFSYVSHPTYDVPNSVERNTIFKTLNKKAKQLRLSGYDGPLGVFLCDGGCHALGSPSRNFGISGADIVRRFLALHPYISFVQVVLVHAKWDMVRARKLELRARLFEGRKFQAVPPGVRHVLMKMVTQMPPPETDPENARATFARWPKRVGHSFRGGCTMTYKSVKFSSRVLLDFLAGRIDHAEFQRQSGVFLGRTPVPGRNLFEKWLQDGRLITDLRIERCSERDDDWVIITSSEPDPAVSDFRHPPGG